jgi:hypothetical protein
MAKPFFTAMISPDAQFGLDVLNKGLRSYRYRFSPGRGLVVLTLMVGINISVFRVNLVWQDHLILEGG